MGICGGVGRLEHLLNYNVSPLHSSGNTFLRFQKKKVDGKDTFFIVGYVSMYPFFAYPEGIRMRIR
jgi:hypothetical protein